MKAGHTRARTDPGHFEAIAASDRHPEVAYVGFSGLQLGEGNENLFNGIAKTTDGGRPGRLSSRNRTMPAANLKASWIEQRAGQGNDNIWFDSPYSLGVAPTNPDVAYATDLFRTYRTLDGGATWQEMNSRQLKDGSWTSRGLDVTTDYGVQFDPFDSRHIYIDYTDIGLFQSTDGGQSWRSTDGVPEAGATPLTGWHLIPAARADVGRFQRQHDLPRPKDWRTQQPAEFTGGVAVSTDGGRHWTPSNAGLPMTPSPTSFSIPPAPPAAAHCTPAPLAAASTSPPTTAVAGRKRTTASPATNLLPGASRSRRMALCIWLSLAAATARTIHCSGAGALYRSTDKAEHWQRIELPTGVTGPTGLEIDPRDPQRLYLTAWGQEGDDPPT